MELVNWKEAFVRRHTLGWSGWFEYCPCPAVEAAFLSSLFHGNRTGWSWDEELQVVPLELPTEMNFENLCDTTENYCDDIDDDWIEYLADRVIAGGWDARTRFYRIKVEGRLWEDNDEMYFEKSSPWTLREMLTRAHQSLSVMLGRCQLNERCMFHAKVVDGVPVFIGDVG